MSARQLFDDHRWIAERIANAWQIPGWYSRDDIRLAALAGLWQAAVRHDQRGNFEAFAGMRIRGAIRDELRKWDNLTRTMRRRAQKSGEYIAVIPLNDNDDGQLDVRQQNA